MIKIYISVCAKNAHIWEFFKRSTFVLNVVSIIVLRKYRYVDMILSTSWKHITDLLDNLLASFEILTAEVARYIAYTENPVWEIWF